ncbi:MAG: glycerate kinase [Actinomycetota bacterium]|nr:glycerate kinase [Actinomycetota bacterium]
MALAAGMRKVGLDVEELPVADGGEGTAEVFAATVGGEWRTAPVNDPLGRVVAARYLVLEDGTAVVEAAEAIGLGRLAEDERDPLLASSRGLGELLLAAAAQASGTILVCLGDSATVDGGAGLREVVGDWAGRELVGLCDVRNPLLGERGAARAFGPQKGASPDQVEILETRLAGMEELRPYVGMSGAGAAGGLGAAIAALGGELVSGAELMLERIDFRGQARGADLVVTGEGTVDRSSTEGKAVGEVVRVCREEGVSCAVFAGRVEEPLPGVEMHVLNGGPDRAADDLVDLGQRLGGALLGFA